MSSALEQLVRQIQALSPEERLEIRRAVEAMSVERPEELFDRKLREMGIEFAPRLPRDPNRPANPIPAVIAGEPLSEILIRERR